MDGKTIRFGLIGAGVAAETHAREMGHVQGGEICAVFARDRAKAERFQSAYNIPAATDDLDAFLANPAMDAVIITTPNGLHHDYGIAAARAGKHVVVEKPLEIDEARAAEIVAACEAAGVRLHVIYQRRYSRAAGQAIEDIAAGKLGRIVLVNIVDNQYRPPRYYEKDAWRGTKAIEGGGCVITQATHLLDLAQFIVGPIVEITAKTDTVFHAIETEDVAVAILKFENGALGSFSTSTATAPGLRHLLTICGTKGSIILNGEHDQIVFRAVDGEPVDDTVPAGFSFADPIDPREYPTEGQRRQLQAIVHALQVDTPSPAGQAVYSVKVVDGLYRSAATGRSVTID